jgi:hypothetical protein
MQDRHHRGRRQPVTDDLRDVYVAKNRAWFESFCHFSSAFSAQASAMILVDFIASPMAFESLGQVGALVAVDFS